MDDAEVSIQRQDSHALKIREPHLIHGDVTISLFALLQNAGGKGFVFVPMIPRVLGYLCPGDMGLGTPAVEQNALLERLTSGRNYDGVILAPSIRLRFRPMELERLQLKRIQSNEKLR